MSYIISVIVSVFILGTLLRNTNYKIRKRNSSYERWDYCQFEDKGRFKFTLWVYILSITFSLIFIWNYTYTIIFCIIWMLCRFKENEYSEGNNLTEIKFYLNNKFINKLIDFLNKEI